VKKGFLTKAIFVLLLALSVAWVTPFIFPIIIDAVRRIVTTSERVQAVTLFWHWLSYIPRNLFYAGVSIASGWALVFVVAQIQYLFKRDKSVQSIFVIVARAMRDKAAYLSKEGANAVLGEEAIRLAVFGIASAATTILVRCVESTFWALGGSVVIIAIFGGVWFLPFIYKRGKTNHLLWQAIADFLVSLAIGYTYGLPMLAAYQVLCFILILIFVIIAHSQFKRYGGEEEEAEAAPTGEPPKKTAVLLIADASGSIAQSKSQKDLIASAQHITDECVKSGYDIVMQLALFGTDSVAGHRGIDTIKAWCPAKEMQGYVHGELPRVYKATGDTPLNAAAVFAEKELLKAKELYGDDIQLIAILVTDGDNRLVTHNLYLRIQHIGKHLFLNYCLLININQTYYTLNVRIFKRCQACNNLLPVTGNINAQHVMIA